MESNSSIVTSSRWVWKLNEFWSSHVRTSCESSETARISFTAVYFVFAGKNQRALPPSPAR